MLNDILVFECAIFERICKPCHLFVVLVFDIVNISLFLVSSTKVSIWTSSC